jgi:hypothetical protein
MDETARDKARSNHDEVQIRTTSTLGVDILDGQLPGLQILVRRLTPQAGTADSAHAIEVLKSLEEIGAEVSRIQRLAARVAVDSGLSARQVSLALGASHHTVQAWVQRSRAEFH